MECDENLKQAVKDYLSYFNEYIQPLYRVLVVDESEWDVLKSPEGFVFASASNIGLAPGKIRVSYIVESALSGAKPVEGVDFAYKTELEEGDNFAGLMIIHPETNEILTWGDLHWKWV